MGFWGHRPCDGDGPHDILCDSDHLVAKHLRAAFKKAERGGKWKVAYEYEALGGVQLLSRIHCIERVILNKCIAIIDREMRAQPNAGLKRMKKTILEAIADYGNNNPKPSDLIHCRLMK